MATQLTQLDPLPEALPFEIVSKTIGRGAYAAVKKAKSEKGVFAVKFIHKQHALDRGGISLRQLQFEVELHKFVGADEGHGNIVRFFASGQDDVWLWIAMEFAAGGDLFDKIEADEGVPEDIAHFYFIQMVSGLGWMHGKGVAHRDMKPENILLDANGNLKIADFGLAVLFQYKGRFKESTSVCGSPPYAAPEVIAGKYRADVADIWSAGVVLFTLLVGNTPWDEPTNRSLEYGMYVACKGRPVYDPWPEVPTEVLSLLRGMMNINPAFRFSLERVRDHPWFTRPNQYMARNGLCQNGIGLATKIMQNLHVDFTKSPHPTQRLSSTQPLAAAIDLSFPMERPQRPFLTQPVEPTRPPPSDSQSVLSALAEEPAMSQFSKEPGVPLSLTQNARRFMDICPSHRLTRFFSTYTFRQLLPILASALHRMGVVVPAFREADYDELNDETWIPIKTEDSRKCALRGDIVVERMAQDMVQVTFEKNVGDPLQWRRFFKEVTVLSKEAVYTGC